ncbi:MAG: hypothetical protein HGB14_10065 [Anaerolineaceae bacterium]|nr:hypothetical protein [Anaerolineaceae bacterium]
MANKIKKQTSLFEKDILQSLKSIEIQMGIETWNSRLPFLYAIYHLIHGNIEKAIYLIDIQLKMRPNVYLIKETIYYLEELEKILKRIPNMDILINFLKEYLEEKI